MSLRPRHGGMIVIDGVDGAGKGVQCARLRDSLEMAGLRVTLTREPGGSPGAEAIRRLVVEGEPGRWDATAELLLMYAARRAHLVETVWPTLEQGGWVVCDRFADSSRAFQGAGGGLAAAALEDVHHLVLGEFVPDLTIILDVPVAVGLARARARGGADRFERKSADYHERVREAFVALAQADPQRHALVDGSATAEVVAERIRGVINDRLGLSLPV